ncbi:MAG: tRNA (N(6)-L-threonylcarbamoyladenosine(37)-C(2))-methylthiotransferase MtaB [Muribaculaceae bacterium]|nr:tRNA (N(6)-L-threonylcarbamoyladenosine(37)-C(2))-methylthiotransferase MtaB [Muribaculaceae bacterium]
MIDRDTFISAPKVYYHTFGCKLNFAETASVAENFSRNGYVTAAKEETPDLVVVNSCSVTAEADRKCRSTLRSFNRRWPNAAILVTGCYAQLHPEQLLEIPGVRAVVGINDKLKLPEIARTALTETVTTTFPSASELREFMPSCSRGDRTRFFLKVQDGCDYWCTYCTIPKARGRSRSGTIPQLVEQARLVAEQGGKEIVLTGVNIGDFGHGRDDNFTDLCRALDQVDGIERYRISSIEPNLLTDELIDFVAGSRAFMPHFHIPLQNGNDEVLKLMRRRYDTALFAAKVNKVKEVIPDAFIGVDLIVGARGETSERFESSKAFVESLPISHLHVFSYSERPGTKALDIEHVVSQEEKHIRSAIMHELSARKHAEFASSFLGTVRPVLLEHGHGDNSVTGGFTDNYLRIETSLDKCMDNTICKMRLDTLMDDGETIAASIVEE